jgi:hypothetical protein
MDGSFHHSKGQSNVAALHESIETGRLGCCAFICTHGFGGRAGESSPDAPRDLLLLLIRMRSLVAASILSRGDERGDHFPCDRDGYFGGELVLS